MKRIRFKQPAFFIGRNGHFKQSGIVISTATESCTIRPITSKGEDGNCEITIPFPVIDEVIQELKRIKAYKIYRESLGGAEDPYQYHQFVDKGMDTDIILEHNL